MKSELNGLSHKEVRFAEFSVLMAVYYKENPCFLKKALESLVKQTLLPSEIVLVKDGPLTEELDLVIESFKYSKVPLKIIVLPENKGLGNALAIGVKQCSYSIIARMDTDDICYPSRFEKQIKVLMENNEIDLIGCWIDEFYTDIENVISKRKVPEIHSDILKYSKSRSPFNHPTVMFRKEAILEVGNYEAYGTFEDYLLWAKFLNSGKKAYNLQESLLFFRTNKDMYKRRGGVSKTIQEIKLQQRFLKMGFINKYDFFFNLFVRGAFRLLPNFVRGLMYKKLLGKMS